MLLKTLNLSFRWNRLAVQKSLRCYKRISRHYRKEAINVENPTYDVIVVGGGHAGAEAASASARMGCKTLLLTSKLETIGKVVGSPSLGGAGSGHLIREIDALDGICGRMCDISGIHYMVVNKHRNPALWGPKTYIDKELYQKNIKQELFGCKNLESKAATVENLMVSEAACPKDNEVQYQCSGVLLDDGNYISSKMVVLAVGTSLRSEKTDGESAATKLETNLKNLGFKHGHLKLGVAPRLEKKSIDFTQLTAVNGDNVPSPFSFLTDSVWIKPEEQMPTYIARTNLEVEEIIRESIRQRRSGELETNLNVPKRGRQQVWLEPEGPGSSAVYLGGFACPLPEDQQAAVIHQLAGLENANIVNPAFDIAYTFIDPRQVTATLETRKVSNLFLAGHLLGTGGYEEAAAQGIIAGINAACRVLHRDSFIISPSEGYVGILVSDIITQGSTAEPHFTALCKPELSAVLRPDNADVRMYEKAATVGCISKRRQQHVVNFQQQLKNAEDILSSDVRPLSEWLLLLNHTPSIDEAPKSALEVFSEPTADIERFVLASPEKFQFLLKDRNFTARLKIEASFRVSALECQRAVEELKRSAALKIPDDINFRSSELKFSSKLQQLFTDIKPATIEDASFIAGVSQDDLLRLLKGIKRHKARQKTKLKKRRQKL